MSNFACEKCGAICHDSEHGYVTGCEHYPPDIQVFCYDCHKPIRAEDDDAMVCVKCGGRNRRKED